MRESKFRFLFRLLAFALIVTTFFPLLYENMPPIIHSYHLYAALWLASILFFCTDLLINKPLRYLVFYGIVTLIVFYLTIWSNVNQWNWSFLRMETYYVITAITVLTYFTTYQDFDGLARLVKWALVFIGITAVMSIYASFKDPTYARSMIGGELGETAVGYFHRLGAGSYSFGEAIVCLFPMMVYFFKSNEQSIFSRRVIIVFALVCFYALLRIQIFADILFALVLTAVSLLGSKRILISLSLAFVFLIMIFLIPNGVYAELAIEVSRYFSPNSVIYGKLHDLSTYLIAGQYVQTSFGYHVARYPLLLYAFGRSPFFGYYFGKNLSVDITEGGHLYWMNKLAVFGLVGLLLYAKIHVDHLRGIVKKLDKEFTFYFLVAALGGLGLGLAKNIAGREFWYTYFVILPGLYYLPLLKRKKEPSEEDSEDVFVEVEADN